MKADHVDISRSLEQLPVALWKRPSIPPYVPLCQHRVKIGQTREPKSGRTTIHINMTTVQTQLRTDTSAFSCYAGWVSGRIQRKVRCSRPSRCSARVSDMKSRDCDCRETVGIDCTAARYRQSRGRHQMRTSLLMSDGFGSKGRAMALFSIWSTEGEGRSGGDQEARDDGK